jgi:hypothetical protein
MIGLRPRQTSGGADETRCALRPINSIRYQYFNIGLPEVGNSNGARFHDQAKGLPCRSITALLSATGAIATGRDCTATNT